MLFVCVSQGISIAFPLAIGMALALGTVLTYLIDESGDALMIFSGVGLGICAILSIAQAYRIMERVMSCSLDFDLAIFVS